MLLALGSAVIAALIALLKGGSLDSLARTRFGWTWVLFLSLVVQVVFDIWGPVSVGPHVGLAITLTSFAGVLFFLVANAHLPGTLIASAGLAMNALVIALNGAMPVSTWAARVATITPESFENMGIKHEILDGTSTLPWLTDIFPLPRLEQVFSLGDAVLAVGLALLVYRCTLREEGERRATLPSASG